MSDRVEFANLLRGVAASTVVLSHYLSSFWYYRSDVSALTGLPAIQEKSIPTPQYVEWLYQIPGIYKGGFGVALFFLISGFVIPFSFSHYTRWGFIVARFFRLWPNYAAGFAVTAFAIAIGTWSAGLPLPYSPESVLIHSVL